MTVWTLVAAMAIILIGCEMFTNGVEWVGRKLNLGDGAVGSILAAVGTALPETIVPIIAILFGASGTGTEIGIGAIIGSSFMLTTLALFVTGSAVAIFSLSGRRERHVGIDPAIMTRDLGFFIIAYSAMLIAGLIGIWEIKVAMAIGLVFFYAFYVYRTLKSDEASEGDLKNLYFHWRADIPHDILVSVQVVAALGMIIFGAKLFVGGIEQVAHDLAVPALVFSMLVTPFATELPEKLNSVLWIRRSKDTLALGNITGAMVFQASILPAVGISLTSWELTVPAFVAAGLGLLAASTAYVQIKMRKSIHFRHLMAMGLVYFGFAIYTFTQAM